MNSAREDVINAMLAFAAEPMAECFVTTPEIQRQVAEMLVDDATLLEVVNQGQDMFQSLVSMTKEHAAEKISASTRYTASVSVGLTVEEKAMLSAANMDMQVKVHDAEAMPHGLAYAQRIIDTQRVVVKSQLRPGVKFLDIGGNQKYWAFTPHAQFVHVCTLGVGEIESHRQTQRTVALELAAVEPAEGCTCGTENCDVQATHAVSVHAISDIDPALWPTIFQKHGLQQVLAVFHYDMAMETEEIGFIPEINAHWFVHEDKVTFHFDNDSSHGYTHNLSWLRTYARPGFFSSPEYDFVVYRHIDFITAGRAQITMIRMLRHTLGYQERVDEHRYFSSEALIELYVPKFDPASGYDIKDPRSYKLERHNIPAAMYDFVYQAGVSNDTDRTDLPLTFDQVRGIVQSYNYTRRINKTDITTPIRLPAQVLDDVVLGLYLVIVQSVAANRAAFRVYSKQMLDLQNRWGSENALMLATKVLGSALLMPFYMLAETFEERVALAASQMRNTLANSAPMATALERCKHRMLPGVATVHGTATQSFEDFNVTLPQISHQHVSLADFYEIFSDVLTKDEKDVLEKHIATEEGDKCEVSTPMVDTEEVSEYPTTREQWFDAMKSFRESDVVISAVAETLPEDVNELQNAELVWKYYGERVTEYALYSADVAMHTVAAAVSACKDTWTASGPSTTHLHTVNVTRDLGAKYFNVGVDGLLDMSDDDSFDCVIDPVDMQHYKVLSRAGQYFTPQAKGAYVFTCETLRIFNQAVIARRAFELAPKMTSRPKIDATLIDGVPGCGKTYRILQAFTMQDLILTTVKSTSEATAKELAGDDRFVKHGKKVTSRVRTLDSANMHGVPLATAVLVDEGLMAHSGSYVMALHQAQAKSLVVYGDSQQIDFIDRGSKLTTLAFDSLFYWTSIIEINETVRCPADATMIFSRFYPEARQSMIKTFSPVMRSITFEYVPNLEDSAYTTAEIPFRYYCLLRADKGKTVKLPGFVDYKHFKGDDLTMPRPVASVHEVQGATVAFGCAFRRNVYNPSIFASKKHLNVMFTRHTHRFVYRSPCNVTDDVAAKLAFTAQTASEEELRKFMLPAPQWLLARMGHVSEKLAKYLI